MIEDRGIGGSRGQRLRECGRFTPLTALALIAIAVLTVGAQEPAPAVKSFAEFLDEIRADAASKGISAATLDRALADLTPEPIVVARDRAQPEQAMSLDAYLARRLTAGTVARARAKASQFRGMLVDVEKAYGVPPPILTAVWGMESAFGQFTGTYGTVRALATLAYDGRRPLFRAELFNALMILDRGDVPFDALKGSWAGAMGQPQFLPSTFLEHAVDFDGDGRTDIWSSTADVLASMASYLKASGWDAGTRWGREVSIPKAVMTKVDRDVPMRAAGCRAVRALTVQRPLTTWRRLGVMLAGGAALPEADIEASLVRGLRRHFLVYSNYEALLAYNCSNPYAVSIGLLADKIPSS